MSPPLVDPDGNGLDAEQEAEAEAEAMAEAEAAAESLREVSPSLVVADRQTLVDAGDTEGLIALAKAYRAGTMGLERSSAESFACYQAAAALGDLSAKHAVGVFHLMGGLGAVDEEKAAVAFRAAANAGFLLSKVYVANFYELGIHYSPNAEKADVWYRSVARAGGVDADEGTEAYVRGLADLGCVRYCLLLAASEELDDDERDAYRKKARAYGYTPERLTRREEILAAASVQEEEPSDDEEGEAAEDADVENTDVQDAEAQSAPDETKNEEKDEAKKPADEELIKTPSRYAWSDAGAAIVLSIVAMAAAVGLGWALSVMAPQYAAAGNPWPVVGAGHPLALPVLVGTLGFLPNFLVYKWTTVLKSLVVSAALGGLGYYLWIQQTLMFKAITVQVPLFAAAGLLLSLYVFAVLGGVRVGWELAHGLDPLD